jgi:glycosyltransferase involved in cell wall biosynthesis
MPKFFFDVTDIARYVKSETTVSGIQRVALEVIRRMVAKYGTDNVKLSYWDDKKSTYFAVDAGFLAEMDEFDVAVMQSAFGAAKGTPGALLPMLARYHDKPMKYRFHLARTNVMASQGKEEYFRKKNMTIEKWEAQKEAARLRLEGTKSEHDSENGYPAVKDVLAAGDRIIVLGANWGNVALDECLSDLSRNRGARVSILCHDLIPLITPEHLTAETAQEFYDWLTNSTRYCSSFFANSEHTGKDLRRFLEEHGVDLPIDVVPLAQDMGRNSSLSEDQSDLEGFAAACARIQGVRQHILNVTKIPYVLVVGTIESRKNMWRLAQVWERISRVTDLDMPRLVLAGKGGICNHDFNEMMRATGNVRGWIQIADKPTDHELSYLFENCLFTGMVSTYEGWGLPIGESLSFGKTAVVANNSSMPEVGGDMVEYCDAMSINSMYDAFYKLITDLDHRKMLEDRIGQTKLRTWDDVASDFTRLLSAD